MYENHYSYDLFTKLEKTTEKKEILADSPHKQRAPQMKKVEGKRRAKQFYLHVARDICEE